MPIKKLCARCNKIVDISLTYCNDCQSVVDEERKHRNKIYDITKRNSRERKFYNSREWDMVKQVVKQRDNGLCILCLDDNVIKMFDVVHHIEAIKNNWERRYDKENCICLCNSCHERAHGIYVRGYEQKLMLQCRMFRLVNKS